jgi:hypothetical protein
MPPSLLKSLKDSSYVPRPVPSTNTIPTLPASMAVPAILRRRRNYLKVCNLSLSTGKHTVHVRAPLETPSVTVGVSMAENGAMHRFRDSRGPVEWEFCVLLRVCSHERSAAWTLLFLKGSVADSLAETPLAGLLDRASARRGSDYLGESYV